MLLAMLVVLIWPCWCSAECSASVESVSGRKRKARERMKPTVMNLVMMWKFVKLWKCAKMWMRCKMEVSLGHAVCGVGAA